MPSVCDASLSRPYCHCSKLHPLYATQLPSTTHLDRSRGSFNSYDLLSTFTTDHDKTVHHCDS